MRKSNELRKTSEQIKNATILIKAGAVILACLVALVSLTYFASYFYDKFSSFTVSVEQYDMIKQGLSLSDTRDFADPTSRIKTASVKECTNISGDSLPATIDSIDGEHNGDNYIATSFYLKNVGRDTVSVRYEVLLSNVTKNVDDAIRIRVYCNGEATTYAKTKNDGSGAEAGTVEFQSLSVAARETVKGFAPDDVMKFTVVIWLEGDDPECVDAIIGGRIKSQMNIEIVESS